MKKTVSAAVGGINFIIDEDAFEKLSTYLDNFRSGLDTEGAAEVMDELEMRIADLFKEKLLGKEVVDIKIVDSVISQLGLPGGQAYNESSSTTSENNNPNSSTRRRRLFRDPDDKILGGVCSGLGYYFDIDPVILRFLFVVAFICGSAGFWIYIILLFIVPKANTAAEKCEMRGLEANADNIRRFSSSASGNSNYRK